MDFDQAFDIGTIQLEPRLQEYIRRKRSNEENDVLPPIPEEQEFCITPYDLKIIKRYTQGKKNLYSGKNLASNPCFVKPDSNQFATNDFKSDPRYQRLKKKMRSHKQARAQISDLSQMDDEYTIFHQSNPYDARPDHKPSHISKPYDQPADDANAFMLNSRDMSRQTHCFNPSKYHHTPEISYRQRLVPQAIDGGLAHSRDTNDVIGNMDMYQRHLNQTYEYVDDQTDHELAGQPFVSHARNQTQREMQPNYQSVPFMYGNGMPDISVADSLRGGYRDSSKKSVGYRNPFENQFDYISKDISDPNHTVQMWPQNSRGHNKEIARPQSIAARSEQRIRPQGRVRPPDQVRSHR